MFLSTVRFTWVVLQLSLLNSEVMYKLAQLNNRSTYPPIYYL